MKLLNKIERWFPSLSFQKDAFDFDLWTGRGLCATPARLPSLPENTFKLGKGPQGEVWRPFTFLFVPSPVVLALSFLPGIYTILRHLFGIPLGGIKYNLYLLTGTLATVLVAILYPTMSLHNYYLFISIFFAFAYLNPDFEIYLFFFSQ